MPTEVTAEITGNIWKIQKSVGDTVAEGDVLVIMESMKMEIPVEAPSAGTIASINTTEGVAVEEGDLLVTINP